MKGENLKKLILILLLFPINLFSADFSLDFEWGNIEKCNTGKPNTVDNPTFKLTNVPEGTKWINFKLKDINVPSYNHGGGWVEYTGENEIKPGEFKYKSPCPPDGPHKYEWTASAKAKKGTFASTISKAKSSKMYP